MPFQGILLDIEGTTTPISFVTDVLFPFARFQVHEYLAGNLDKKDVQEIVRALKIEHDDDVREDLSPPKWTDEPMTQALPVVAYVSWLMDRDRKSTALKALQGKVWHDGYRNGKLRGEGFPDVPVAFGRWKQNRKDVRIYSSGSELSQRLLFGSTEHGDLTRFLRGYFDTNLGAKVDPDSYRKIAEAFYLPPAQIVFISDVTRELDAAQEAGMATRLCLRPGNHMQVMHNHGPISSFEEIE